MFDNIAIANRGEIAARIMRTLHRLGIRSTALYSDADARAPFVHLADAAYRLGPAAPLQSYLDVERVVEAAVRAGADALHPGYGFLSESAALVQACDAAGLTFIGPSAEAMAAMGDKIRARDTVAAAGVPVVPGCSGVGMTDDELVDAAAALGMPVILKPSAGGGGKGMRVVRDVADLAAQIAASRREARASFGDDTLLVERFVTSPRHIEVQVAADRHGNVVHIGERECTLQRRHQKIIEESPSPFVTEELRAALGAQAVAVARSCSYTNVGTVEFIVPGDRKGEFFFMEMNTRLQVEHAVTEEVYGIDLVEVQLRLAAGEPLPWTQDEIVPSGHAIEARVYAEDPAAGFLPTGGVIHLLREPDAAGVRVDAGWQAGAAVESSYDPMLAKIIGHGATRAEAIARLRNALAATTVLGVTTNLSFLHRLLGEEDVVRGAFDTGFVERLTVGETSAPDAAVAAAWLLLLDDGTRGADLWSTCTGWRLGGWQGVAGEIDIGERRASVRAVFDGSAWEVIVDGGDATNYEVDRSDDLVQLRTATGSTSFSWASTREGSLFIGRNGASWAAAVVDGEWAAGGGPRGDGLVVSPMPGTVVAVLVAEGDDVVDGEPLAVVEAMKMEHTLTSPGSGVVAVVHVHQGEQVALKAPLVTVKLDEEAT